MMVASQICQRARRFSLVLLAGATYIKRDGSCHRSGGMVMLLTKKDIHLVSSCALSECISRKCRSNVNVWLNACMDLCSDELKEKKQLS